MIGYGIIGGNSMVAVQAVNPAIDASDSSILVSICSLSGEIDSRWIADKVDTYQEVIDDPAVDIVYIALPNGMHREWVEKVATVGKHVLCEKPLGCNLADTEAMVSAAEEAGVLLVEAWMTPFAPRWQEAMRLTTDGTIGTVERIESTFTFTIGESHDDNYRWDPAQGGGALLDVGIYVLGPAVALWGADPEVLSVSRSLAPSGVDASTDFVLRWPGGQELIGATSFERNEEQTLRYIGSAGVVELRTEAHTMNPDCTEIWVDTGQGFECRHVEGADPYERMVTAVAQAALSREPEPPRSPADVLALARLVDRIATTE